MLMGVYRQIPGACGTASLANHRAPGPATDRFSKHKVEKQLRKKCAPPPFTCVCTYTFSLTHKHTCTDLKNDLRKRMCKPCLLCEGPRIGTQGHLLCTCVCHFHDISSISTLCVSRQRYHSHTYPLECTN